MWSLICTGVTLSIKFPTVWDQILVFWSSYDRDPAVCFRKKIAHVAGVRISDLRPQPSTFSDFSVGSGSEILNLTCEPYSDPTCEHMYRMLACAGHWACTSCWAWRRDAGLAGFHVQDSSFNHWNGGRGLGLRISIQHNTTMRGYPFEQRNFEIIWWR